MHIGRERHGVEKVFGRLALVAFAALPFDHPAFQPPFHAREFVKRIGKIRAKPALHVDLKFFAVHRETAAVVGELNAAHSVIQAARTIEIRHHEIRFVEHLRHVERHRQPPVRKHVAEAEIAH